MYIIYLLSFNASSRQSRTSIPTCRVFDVQTDIENRYRVVLIIGYFVRWFNVQVVDFLKVVILTYLIHFENPYKLVVV